MPRPSYNLLDAASLGERGISEDSASPDGGVEGSDFELELDDASSASSPFSPSELSTTTRGVLGSFTITEKRRGSGRRDFKPGGEWLRSAGGGVTLTFKDPLRFEA